MMAKVSSTAMAMRAVSDSLLPVSAVIARLAHEVLGDRCMTAKASSAIMALRAVSDSLLQLSAVIAGLADEVLTQGADSPVATAPPVLGVSRTPPAPRQSRTAGDSEDWGMQVFVKVTRVRNKKSRGEFHLLRACHRLLRSYVTITTDSEALASNLVPCPLCCRKEAARPKPKRWL
jgi:hypothetical protein